MSIIDDKRAPGELRGYVKKRIENMRERMLQKGVDAAILLRPENVFYFSNFNPIIISHVPYFIITKEKAVLLVHAIRYAHAMNEGAVDHVLCYGKWGSAVPVALDAYDAIHEIIGDEKITLGVEGDYASVNVVKKLSEKLDVKGVVDIAQDALDLRLIKDPYEIQMCRISGECARAVGKRSKRGTGSNRRPVCNEKALA